MSFESTVAFWLIGGCVLFLMVALFIAVRRTRIKPDGNELMAAIRAGRYVKASKLIKMGVDINFRDKDWRTPLMVAAVEGRFEIVSVLTKNGADVNAADRDGNTALTLALGSRKVDIVELLKNNGACQPDPV